MTRQYDKGPIFITPMRRGDYRAECHACLTWWNDFTTEEAAKDAADQHLVNKHRKPSRRRTA